jgi:hypothetical protein
VYNHPKVSGLSPPNASGSGEKMEKLHSHKNTSINDTNSIVIKVSSWFLGNDGSTVVERLSHHPKVTGLSPATAFGTRRGKTAKIPFLHFHKKTSINDPNNIAIKVSSCFLGSDGTTEVEYLSHQPKVIGLGLATATGTKRGKNGKKSFFTFS